MSLTVFLADDHTVLRDTLRFMLEAQIDGCTVVGDAANGRDAVQKIIAACPDIAILDITMPELGGIEATRQICAACPATKIIILSIHSTKSYITRALQAGAHGYVLKESGSRAVLEAIQAIRQGHHYLSPAIADIVVTDYKHRLATDPTPLAQLSAREREILQLLVEGYSNNDIGDRLMLSPQSVKTYRKRIMQKLDLHDFTGLIKFAIQAGLITLE